MRSLQIWRIYQSYCGGSSLHSNSNPLFFRRFWCISMKAQSGLVISPTGSIELSKSLWQNRCVYSSTVPVFTSRPCQWRPLFMFWHLPSCCHSWLIVLFHTISTSPGNRQVLIFASHTPKKFKIVSVSSLSCLSEVKNINLWISKRGFYRCWQISNKLLLSWFGFLAPSSGHVISPN